MHSPMSSAALASKREIAEAALAALVAEGWYNPVLESAERTADGEITAWFIVEVCDGRRDARKATIRTDGGFPEVTVVRGWPV